MGLIVNPVAGVGGSVALKGSDGVARQTAAVARGGEFRAGQRCREFLAHLIENSPDINRRIEWLAAPGVMGEYCIDTSCWSVEVAAIEPASPTTAADTRHAARALLDADVDLLVFTGGDGTARDVLAAVGTRIPVLGVPAGVKMHSGVFAVTPRTAALLLSRLVAGEQVAPVLREVRDYDDTDADDALRIRSFGEMRVPEAGGYLQQTKVGGKESESLAVEEICAGVLALLPADRTLVVGPGSTCAAIKRALGMTVTLRGVDVRPHGQEDIAGADVTAADLESLHKPVLVVSFTRQQGFLFGRGNQQISAKFLNALQWPEDVLVVGTRTKLNSLERRPLLVDTGDDELDVRLSGLVEVITGFEDSLLYRLTPGGE